MRLFVPLVKVDEETRTVYGRLTQEIVDKAGEIFDYATSKPLFEKWSGEFAKVTDGKSLGNVRAMHGKVAAGKLTELEFNDADKAVDIAAKIVDDNEWQKCLEGVYTGYSLGGRYVKKWDDSGATRYTAQPAEASLVDAPCVPTARFTLVKADGQSEEREFSSAVPPWESLWGCGLYGADHRHVRKDDARRCIEDQQIAKLLEGASEEERADLPPRFEKVAARADVSPKSGTEKYGDVKFADEKNKKYPIDTAAHIRAAWNYINKPKNAGKYSAADVKSIKSKIVSAWKDKIDPKGPPKAAKKNDAGHFEKGMYGVARFAQIIEDLDCLAESQAAETAYEGDGSDMAQKLKSAVSTLGVLLLAMAQEETDELTEGDDIEVFELAEGAEFQKIAFNAERYPALAKFVQATGDGGATTAGGTEVNQEEFTKALGDRDAKIEKLETANTALEGKLAKAEEALAKAGEDSKAQGEKIEALTKTVEEIGRRAAPAKGKLHVISKSSDTGGSGDGTLSEDDLEKAIAAMSPEERTELLFKVAQRNPQTVAQG